MKILNIRQHSTTQYTAKVTTASGQVRPLHVRIDDDGELLFSLSALLRAGGYAKNPISSIHNFIANGAVVEKHRAFHLLSGQCHSVTESEAVEVIRRSKRIPDSLAGVIREVARQVRNAVAGLPMTLDPTPAPAPKPSPRIRRVPSSASLADQAAGIAWLTTILADTSLPYSLHEQALRTRAGLLSIGFTLQLAGAR